jgi:hypothetical protein
MVLPRMGLLDDAIREHLELKRLRGADPGDVAREEHDALGPVPRTADASGEESGDALEPEETAAGEALGDADELPSGGATGQETVEINMEAELHGEATDTSAASSERRAGPRATPVGHPAHAPANAEDSLEWEMPGDRSAEEDEGHEEPGGEEPVEDVLEETPDFLRETPEHERLWFEQQPPRDFDFNE